VSEVVVLPAYGKASGNLYLQRTTGLKNLRSAYCIPFDGNFVCFPVLRIPINVTAKSKPHYVHIYIQCTYKVIFRRVREKSVAVQNKKYYIWMCVCVCVNMCACGGRCGLQERGLVLTRVCPYLYTMQRACAMLPAASLVLTYF
jgi:hypothetical protein